MRVVVMQDLHFDDWKTDRQTAEIQIRIALMNRFNPLGTAEIARLV